MSPDALAQLARWGLAASTAQQVGIFETQSARSLYSEMPPDPALVIPYFNPVDRRLIHFERGNAQLPYARLRWIRPQPRYLNGGFSKPKVQRYLQPKQSGVRAYFPPTVPDWQGVFDDARIPLILTEGEAKGLVGCEAGFHTIAFGGVYSFADRNGELLPELEEVHWNGRSVYICYDSDAIHNVQILAAEARLVDELQRKRGARVHLVRIPQQGDAKVGLDDYIRQYGPEAFERLAMSAQSLGALDAKVVALNRQVAWIEREGMVYDIEQKMFIKKDNFVNGSQFGSQMHITTGSTQRTPTKAVSIAATWLKHPHASRFSEALFRPNQPPMVFGETGRPAMNMWEGYREEPGDVQPFLELSQHLFSRMRPEDRDLPLRLIAYKAQHPEEKVPLALVLVGPQGVGKSLWGDIVRGAFEPHSEAIGATQLTSNFGGWMERSLIVVMNEAAAEVMAQASDRLKTLISDLNQPMEEKYRPRRTIQSYSLYIINSNRAAIGAFEADDRRMIVVRAPAPRDLAFYERIFAWRKAGGDRHLMHWLLHVDLAGWKPPQRAPASAEKTMAYRESLTVVQELAEQMRTAREHTIVQWFDAAMAWATRAEAGPNPSLAAFAQVVRESLSNIEIRPWYTPQELAMIFPAVVEQTLGSRLNRSTPAGAISRELRDAGIPYLENVDDPRGFYHGDKLRQYLVIVDFDDWREPITQGDFDRLMKNWPTYHAYKAGRLRG